MNAQQKREAEAKAEQAKADEAEAAERGQPGLHPANQPPSDERAKGPRGDLEDVTGNPGHRGVNPNAPTGSINEPPGSQTIPPGLEGDAEKARRAMAGHPAGEAPREPQRADDDEDDNDNKTRR